jgi:D-3-phosphoglycerate dehydrogenase
MLAKKNIRLVSLRGERAFLERIRATPEHTLGLMLALLRQYRGAFLDTGNRHWDRNRFRGEELFGMRVGIIGLGRVGGIVASYLCALGAVVGYIDLRSEVARHDCQRYSVLSELIESSALIVMCASYEGGAPPILDEKHVQLLQGKYFVNTARGELVDEVALLDLAGRGGLKGLATDVIADETGANRLEQWLQVTTGRNIIVTPHIGGATWASMAATEEFIVDKLLQQLAVEKA